MHTFTLQQSRTEVYTSHGGLALVGHCLNRHTSLTKTARTVVKRHGIPNIDLIRTYLGLVTQGKSDFEAAESVRRDPFFKSAMGIKQSPSSARLRQRFDEDARALTPLLDDDCRRTLRLMVCPVGLHGDRICGFLHGASSVIAVESRHLQVHDGKDTTMNTHRILYRLLPSLLTGTTILSGCSFYYESKAEDMVQRQMDAMVFVEGGEFMMGNPGGWDGSRDSWPPHKVVLDDFYIQKYEVTQGDFELFMEVAGYESSHEFYEKRRADNSDRFQSDLPAVATWNDASAFCHWLGQQSGKPVKLPTEAEWEYAARARGQMLRYATPNGEAIEGETMAAKVERNRYNEPPLEKPLPKPPGTFPPNPIGLHDMSGNAAEWVRDYYSEDYYELSSVNNPEGPEEPIIDDWHNSSYRVVRGGDFNDFAGNTTVTRSKAPASIASNAVSFRCSYSSGD